MSRFLSKVSVSSKSVLWLAVALCWTSSAQAAVTISTAATSNMSCVSGVCTPTATNAVLNVNDLTTMLGSGNVEVNTGTGSLAQQVEDIIVAASFNWASANSLTLDAYRSVVVSAPVAVNGSAAVALLTNDGGSGGNLFFVSGGSLSFLGTANSLSVNGNAYTLVDSVVTLAADIAAKSSGYYALSTSYDASRDGTYRGSPIPTKFKGSFNGLGNTISNLAIKGTKFDFQVGLFSDVASKGAVASVLLANATVSALANKKYGSESFAGVLVGENSGAVFNVSGSGQISAKLKLNRSMELGGLVGRNNGSILDSSASTSVSASAKEPSSFVLAAGLAGVGAGNSSIQQSYATGAVSIPGVNAPSMSGGLVGYNEGLVENCYAGGATTVSNDSDAGGLVGLTYFTVINSYSTGATSGGNNSDVGGLIGFEDHQVDGGTIADDYWDTTTSGITNLSQGAGNIANDPGIAGETSAQLQAGLPAGFDPTIWAENPSINNGLPYLIANPPL
jgi:hypothetical protein